MPDYPQVVTPAIPIPPDQAPQAPGLLAIEPWAWAVPTYHLHHWSPTLRCIECGWTYYAVLARAKAVREEAPPCI